MLFKVISLSIQCRSATAAVEERFRACLNAQGSHFEQHLINKVVGTNEISFIYLLCLNNSLQ